MPCVRFLGDSLVLHVCRPAAVLMLSGYRSSGVLFPHKKIFEVACFGLVLPLAQNAMSCTLISGGTVRDRRNFTLHTDQDR